MRKLNGKLIVSALIAASMVSMSAISASASAADYGSLPIPTVLPVITPVTPATTDSTSTASNTETSTSGTASDVSDSEDTVEPEATEVNTSSTGVVNEAAAISAIENANGGTVTIEVKAASNGKITLTEGTIGALKDSKATLVIEVEGEDYSIAISDVKDAASINIAMDVTTASNGASALADLGVDAGDFSGSAIVIAPGQKGEFGMTLTINLPASAVADLDTDNLRLYYVDDDGVASEVKNGVKVNADGSISIAMTHASAYVVTDEVLALDTADIADDFDSDDDFDDDFEDDFDDFSDDDDSDDFGTDDDDVDDLFIDDYDDSANDVDAADEGKNDAPATDDSVIVEAGEDSNPGTGVGIALGTLAVTAVSAAAIAVTSKKRK